MKVKELIAELSNHDPDAAVEVWGGLDVTWGVGGVVKEGDIALITPEPVFASNEEGRK